MSSRQSDTTSAPTQTKKKKSDKEKKNEIVARNTHQSSKGKKRRLRRIQTKLRKKANIDQSEQAALATIFNQQVVEKATDADASDNDEGSKDLREDEAEDEATNTTNETTTNITATTTTHNKEEEKTNSTKTHLTISTQQQSTNNNAMESLYGYIIGTASDEEDDGLATEDASEEDSTDEEMDSSDEVDPIDVAMMGPTPRCDWDNNHNSTKKPLRAEIDKVNGFSLRFENNVIHQNNKDYTEDINPKNMSIIMADLCRRLTLCRADLVAAFKEIQRNEQAAKDSIASNSETANQKQAAEIAQQMIESISSMQQKNISLAKESNIFPH